MGHYHMTGPEIWRQTSDFILFSIKQNLIGFFLFLDGKVDAFVMSTGTGGTLAGTSMYLKEKNKNIRTVLADPPVC